MKTEAGDSPHALAAIKALRNEYRSKADLRLDGKDDGPVMAGVWSAYEEIVESLDDLLAGLRGVETGWQDIASGPHNATWVLGLRGEEVQRVHWASDLSGGDQPAFQGWFVAVCDSRGRTLRFDPWEPSHWMPLPPAPSTRGPEGV